MSSGVRFFSAGPVSVIVFIILIGLLILLIPLFILGIIGAAFIRLGFSWISALAVVLLMIFGSFINIPLYRIPRDVIRVSRNNSPGQDACISHSSCSVWDTSVSCNLGGAIIPAGISVYLLYQAILITGASLVITVCAGIIIVATITFVMTRIVPGGDIHVPLLIPGLTALLVGLILSGGAGLAAGVTAFVSGTIGTLSGGNIANLFRVKMLEIPEVSIGGAGTFGTIIICCVLPSLVA
ncbi:MAG: DUF1614 domain-containing protein [Methanoregula sp.]|jgi:uncharacterized membrane protein